MATSPNERRFLSVSSTTNSKSKKSFNSLRGTLQPDAFDLVSMREAEQLKKALSKCTSKSIEKFYFDRNEQQLTPLALACKMEALDELDVFLQGLQLFPNVDINHQDQQGYTILHTAVTMSTEKTLRKLLSCAQLNADILNSDKNSALHYFCEKYGGSSPVPLLKVLIQKGEKDFFFFFWIFCFFVFFFFLVCL
jgi:hypothetical protein